MKTIEEKIAEDVAREVSEDLGRKAVWLMGTFCLATSLVALGGSLYRDAYPVKSPAEIRFKRGIERVLKNNRADYYGSLYPSIIALSCFLTMRYSDKKKEKSEGQR